MKICFRCELRLPYAAFHRFSRSQDGYYATCKECRRNGRVARTVILSGPTLDLVAEYGLRPMARLLGRRYGGRSDSHYRALERARQYGIISLDLADKICIALGTHLAMVDPFYWDAA